MLPTRLALPIKYRLFVDVKRKIQLCLGKPGMYVLSPIATPEVLSNET
jgi:hypothetical protein